MFNIDKTQIFSNISYKTPHTLKGFKGGNCNNYVIKLRDKSMLNLNHSKRGFCSIRRFSTNKLSTKDKKEFELSSYQKDVLFGIILGDGFLEKKSNLEMQD